MELAGDSSIQFTQHDHLRHQREHYIHFVRDTFLVNLCSVAALAWVAYDLILHSGKEVSLVWDRWHLPKGRHARRIYVIVRYFSVLNLSWFVWVNTRPDLTANFCNAWYYIVVLNTAAITLLPDAMILIRINAVYAWNMKTLVTTASLFFAQLISSLAIGFLTVSTAQINAPIGPLTPGCSIGSFSLSPVVTLAAWIPSIAAQFAYFVLMVISLLGVMRDLDPDGKPTRESLSQVRELIPTMAVFMKHGVSYFFVAIATKIANAVIVVRASGPLQAIGIPWMIAIYPVLVSHIYLDMVQYLRMRRSRPTTRMHHAAPNSVRLSYSSQEPSHRFDLGQMTFAPPSSMSLSRASTVLDLIDEEF